MKKTKSLLAVIIILGIILTACGSKTSYERNPNYTYGTLENNDIESVYELVGNPSHNLVEDYSEFGKGSRGSFMMEICETASGGIVAYGEGIYVYSPDKNDKKGVQSAFSIECINNKNSSKK